MLRRAPTISREASPVNMPKGTGMIASSFGDERVYGCVARGRTLRPICELEPRKTAAGMRKASETTEGGNKDAPQEKERTRDETEEKREEETS